MWRFLTTPSTRSTCSLSAKCGFTISASSCTRNAMAQFTPAEIDKMDYVFTFQGRKLVQLR